MRNYYFIKNGAQSGPYTLDQLQYHGILPETMVWYDGLPEWMEARAVPELSELFVVPVSMAVPPPVPSQKDGKEWVTTLLRIAAVGTFVLMIVVAYWRFAMVKEPDQPIKPNPKPVVIDSVLPDDNNITIDVVTYDDKNEVKDRKEYLRQHWSELVKVSVVDADYKDFGGMSDVYVWAKNSMEYDVELIVFEARYILENGEIWKTREFHIRNVRANSESVPIQIEGSHRGKKIEFESINIICKAIGIEQELHR